jgi:hypothetical protein
VKEPYFDILLLNDDRKTILLTVDKVEPYGYNLYFLHDTYDEKGEPDGYRAETVISGVSRECILQLAHNLKSLVEDTNTPIPDEPVESCREWWERRDS